MNTLGGTRFPNRRTESLPPWKFPCWKREGAERRRLQKCPNHQLSKALKELETLRGVSETSRDALERRSGTERTVPGSSALLLTPDAATVLGGKWHGRTVLPKNRERKKRCWRLPRGNGVVGLGSGTRLPGGGDDAPCRPLFQTRFYLVAPNHSGQTRSSACLPAQQPKPRPHEGPPPSLRSVPGPSPFAGAVWVLTQPVLAFHVKLWLCLPGSLSLPLPATLGKWASPGIFITIPIAAKRLRQRPGGGCAPSYEAQGREDKIGP